MEYGFSVDKINSVIIITNTTDKKLYICKIKKKWFGRKEIIYLKIIQPKSTMVFESIISLEEYIYKFENAVSKFTANDSTEISQVCKGNNCYQSIKIRG